MFPTNRYTWIERHSASCALTNNHHTTLINNNAFTPPSATPRSFHHKDTCPSSEQYNKNPQCIDQPRITRRALTLSTTSAFLVPVASSLASTPSPASSSTLSPSPYSDIPSPSSIPRYREAKMVMRLIALRGSVPRSYVEDFARALEGYGMAAMSTKPQLADIWDELTGYKDGVGDDMKKKRKKKKGSAPTTADLVTLGDTWLQRAIANDLIQPIENAKKYRYWNALPHRWQQLVTRSNTGHVDPSGRVWAVPYRWGCTLILYRKDNHSHFKQPSQDVNDWDDLLRPSLKKKVGISDNPREFIGIVLKTFGLSFNATATHVRDCGLSDRDLVQRARELAQQVTVFSNTHHVRAFAAGEIDALVGWSDDILPLAKRSNAHAVCVPLSGTSLWADMWTIPKYASGGARDGEPSPLIPAWFELGLQPIRIRRSMGLEGGASPLLLPPSSKTSPQGKSVCTPIRTELSGTSSLIDGVFPSNEVLQRSEFLNPLDGETEDLYRKILLQMKHN